MSSPRDSMSGLSLEEKRKLLAELMAKSGKSAPRIFPLASGQKALWLLQQQEPEGAAYNTPFALRIRSQIDVAAFKRAFEMVAARHPSLRTTVSSAADGQLLQTSHPVLEPHFAHTDASGWTAEQLQAAVVRAYRQPFSLERGPLLRGDLFSAQPDDHILLITVHHIVYDGWSAGILQGELTRIYQALSSGEQPSLAPVTGSYADFVAQQTEMLAGAAGRAHGEYWQKKLAGELPVLALPADRSRSALAANRSGACSIKLQPELTNRIKELAQGAGATPFVVLLSAYAALLGRLARQEDLLIGSPTAGRPGAAFHGVVGYFANSVALRADLTGAPSTRQLIARMRDVVHEALANQDYPFASLVERLGIARRPGVSPIFQASMSFHSSREGGDAMALWSTPDEETRVKWGNLELEPYPLSDQETQFDLTLEMWEVRGAFAGALRFNRALFNDSTVGLWRGYFEKLLEQMVRAPDEPIARLALAEPVTATQPQGSTQLVGQVDRAGESTITAWFEAQVARTPDAAALSFGDVHLSYAELNARANVVAHEVRGRGVGPESLVGICVERSAELVIAILGVLKAGGAYVPLDPASPRERLALILEDAEVTALVTETKRRDELPTEKVPTIFVDALQWQEGQRAPNPAPGLTPDNAAYVIYTSGSTGRPKGVIVTHANATRLFTTTDALYGFGPSDVWTLFHSAAFDFSVWELWGALFYGGRLVVVPHWMTRSPEAFGELIAREGVTVLNQTPSAFRALLRAPSIADGVGGRGLKWIIFGGEALDAATVRPWFERYADAATRLINMYGITETTVHVTYHHVTQADLSSAASLIGRPIPDLVINLLDEHGQPVPDGVPGEMYVGGAGVARGYLKRPELTAQRFIHNPSAPSERLYRSGDLAIRQQDGTFTYLGRIDDQVKIRGFRIELGEIQSVMARHPAVADAYVSTYERSADDRRIVAYVVPKQGASEMLLSSTSDGGIGDTHVGEWKSLYDDLYARSEGESQKDPSFNIAGWNSSYSGAPLSAEAMKEWVNHTVQQVLDRAPSRVLEIGCGTGLLLTRIAPSTAAYWATDVSGVVVNMLKGVTKKTPGLEHAKLFHCAADQLGSIDFGDERFEAVILNSVIQYFPSAEYLARALESASARVSTGGFIFVGDVRNLRLLEAFHASIVLAQSSGTLEPQALKERVARRMAGEEELVLDPGFFWSLKQRIPRLSHVEIRPKRGAYLNELTRFRYDVLLHLDTPPAPAPDVAWGPGNVSLPELRARLSGEGARRIGLRGVRNARVEAALEALASLSEQASTRPGAFEKLRRRLLDRDAPLPTHEPEPGIDPEALAQLAGELSFDVSLDWSRGGVDGSFDAVFTRRAPPGTSAAVGSLTGPIALFGAAPEPVPAARHANDPLRERMERRLESDLRKRAQDQLPDYMVPASIMVIDAIPMTGNGKVDRRALPVPAAPQGLETAYVEPRTGEEEILVSIFAELLGAERVGVHESFFDLGGHSLLATQVVSRARAVFGVDVPLRTLFDSPTVAGLAAAVQQLRKRSNAAALDFSPPMERPPRIPLSSSQERLWVLDRIEETRAPIYIIPLVLRLRGTLNQEALRQSLDGIIQRHEALRTRFPTVDGQPVQEIAEELHAELPPSEELGHGAGATEAEISKLIQEQAGLEVSRPFDLERGPLFRMRLLRISEGDHVLVLTMHHIISDGWSVGLLTRELAAGYNALQSRRELVMPALPAQYADFALWQRKMLREGALSESIEAHKQRLAGAPASLELPSDRPRPGAPSFKGGVVRFPVDRALTARLKEMSRREGATLYMTLLTAYSAYLSRLSGMQDLIIGSPVANRNRAATEPLIGFFVNTLALRVDLSGDPTFLELLARVRRTALDAYADQDVPFEKLVEVAAPERSLSRQPLVQVMFALQNAPFTPPALDGLNVELLELDSITAKFDLTLSMQETADGLSGLLEYSAELFDRGRIERMAEHLVVLLREVVEHPGRRVPELNILDAREAGRLAEWATGPSAPAVPGSVVEMFLEQVARAPDAIAIERGDLKLSYGELDRRSTRLARHLATLGFGPEKRAALCLPGSVEFIVSMLGVWKAGGAYVPVDPEYPEARIEHMLEDSSAELLLTVRAAGERPRFQGRTLWMDEEIPEHAHPPELGLPSASAAAYVIYTSGSTGKPKGAVLEHRGLANISAVSRERFALGADGAVLQFASPSFDASVWEITAALTSGARLVLPTDETSRAGEGLAALLTQKRISLTLLPPSTLAALPEGAYPDLRVLISGGEACTAELVKKWAVGSRRFFNAYGPTETTIYATLAELTPDQAGAPPIGRPIPGSVVRILDSAQRQVPIGVPGELCIGGIAVGRGYHGLESLTRERFIQDTFSSNPAARLYRSGDLARWRSDGSIDYLGRLDHQVKLRGYRIELGEVEAAISSHPGVQQALITVHKGQLAAYAVGRGGAIPTVQALREHAKARLPAYMVPAHILLLDAFPMTPNGKIDRKKLPDPVQSHETETFVAPQTHDEQVLARIWAEVLKKDPIGIHDNFFALGGDSILGLQIISRATQQGLRLRPRQLFEHQTIMELAKVASSAQVLHAEQGRVTGSVPLTPIQRWFFEQERAEPQHFNMAVLIDVDPGLDLTVLRRALDVVELHHDALRLRYRRDGEAWSQEHAEGDACGIPLEERDVAGSEGLEAAIAGLHRSFELERGPLMRAALLRMGPGSARLALVAHHLMVDAVSWGIILEDLLTAYSQILAGQPAALQAKTTSFQHWVNRLEAYAASPNARAELDAWLAAGRQDGSQDLPLHDASASDTAGEASTLVSWLEADETQLLLSEVPTAYDVKVNEVLIAALAKTLSGWTGQNTVRIDLDGHGREFLFEDVDLSRTVGWFASLFPLRLHVGAKENSREMLARVKDALRRIPSGGIGYGLLRYLSPDASIRSRLQAVTQGGVVFNYLGQMRAIPEHGAFRGVAKEGVGLLHSPVAARPHRIEINAAIEAGQRLRINWTFGPKVLQAETVERLSSAFIANLRAMIRERTEPAAAVRVAADFPAARLSAKDLKRVLTQTKKPR
ncbi:non-ribosomal peptide synthetase [Stigmatella aurantiaca]|uniref:Nonribosomal peptide synthetase (Modules 1 and 2) n=2 Tax=Stigmatella aurantiaca TaxID=41 RepID=Q50JA3_STIAU|nr:non-ribosomal peptide synthetase [Stigmatella aurantiaca]ADO68947.1 Linear gramicidin synthetase subunit D [Stigmatella aurantiaca DW4/3-1]APZ78821.1 nonribosomal peptide synthetase [Stigmatella aurantiaca DW4/3-1]CAG29031.1 nonribosomal peptide synthetase (modules 1 and 2) [Stigmatella aurantiaca]